jgi:nucleoside 2-deoxyribosyltransferase
MSADVVTASQEELRRETMRQKHLFIAAPFFTPSEKEVVTRIEDLADAHGLPFFSAMREPPNPLTPEQYKDPAILHEINQMCIKGINGSFAMLAWLDRQQYVGDEVMLIYRPKTIPMSGLQPRDDKDRTEKIVDGVIKKRNLVKTDDGVVWEMGYASCMGIPILGFTFEKDLRNINPMISQNVLTIATGWDNLDRLLRALGSPEAVLNVAKLADEWNSLPKDIHLPPR